MKPSEYCYNVIASYLCYQDGIFFGDKVSLFCKTLVLKFLCNGAVSAGTFFYLKLWERGFRSEAFEFGTFLSELVLYEFE